MASGFPESVPAWYTGPDRSQLLHDVGASTEGRQRQPAAHDLPEHGQVGRDAVELLRAAAGDAEAGDDLVEDEQRTGRVAERAQDLEEAWVGRDDSHVPGDGLDDDRRQPLAVALDRGSGSVDVVVGGHDRVAGGARGHARCGREAEGRKPGAGFGEQAVGVTVVAARELEDAVAPGEPAREPKCAHRRLGARGDEPHLLDRRHGVDDLLGQLDLPLRRRAEGRPVGSGFLHRLDHLRIGVAEHERAPGHDPVDVALPVRVPEVRALAARGEERILGPDRPPGADRRVDAAGDDLARAAEEAARGQSQPASSFVQYETITSAPARLIAVRPSTAAWRSSSQPRAAAAFTIAYSPLTL